METPRPYLVQLWTGERIELRLFPAGRSACPVCGHIGGGRPPYSYGEFGEDGLPCGQRKSEWAKGSMDICPCCRTQFGLTDFQPDYPRFTQVQLWAKLRALWLDEVGWSESALRQLRDTLGVTENQARRDSEELKHIPYE